MDSLVVSLIVLVPLEPGVHSVEEPRFPRSVLVLPAISPRIRESFLQVEELFIFIQILGGFFFVKTFGGEIGKGGGRS